MGEALIVRRGGSGGKPYTGANPIVPSTVDQVIPAGTFIKEAVTILGDADLKEENIRENTELFGRLGIMKDADSAIGFILSYYNAEGFPTKAKVNMPAIPAAFLRVDNITISKPVTRYLENIEIIGETIGNSAFYEYFGYGIIGVKAKLKTKNIKAGVLHSFAYYDGPADDAFAYGSGKIWISKDCETIEATHPDHALANTTRNNITFYCEATAKPSGWGDYWSTYTSNADPRTVMWGVTEAAFDAL